MHDVERVQRSHAFAEAARNLERLVCVQRCRFGRVDALSQRALAQTERQIHKLLVALLCIVAHNVAVFVGGEQKRDFALRQLVKVGQQALDRDAPLPEPALVHHRAAAAVSEHAIFEEVDFADAQALAVVEHLHGRARRPVAVAHRPIVAARRHVQHQRQRRGTARERAAPLGRQQRLGDVRLDRRHCVRGRRRRRRQHERIVDAILGRHVEQQRVRAALHRVHAEQAIDLVAVAAHVGNRRGDERALERKHAARVLANDNDTAALDAPVFARLAIARTQVDKLARVYRRAVLRAAPHKRA